MALQVTNYKAPVLGTGSPDGTTEVSSGKIRPGISLNNNQLYRSFGLDPSDDPQVLAIGFPYPVPWVIPVIPPGGMEHIRDLGTGMPMPYNIPVGYTLTLYEKSIAFNQDCSVNVFFDGLLVLHPFEVKAGLTLAISNIFGISSAFFDPDALYPHTADFQIRNNGKSDMSGGIEMACILEKLR